MSMLARTALGLFAASTLAAAVTPADGAVKGPFVDRSKLKGDNQFALSQFGYLYEGTKKSPALLDLTGQLGPKQKDPVPFNLMPGRQTPGPLRVTHAATSNAVAVIQYTGLNSAGEPVTIRKGTGTAPILAGWATPVVVSVVADATDASYLIATFGVQTRNNGSLPYLVEISQNSVRGGATIGTKPADFRAPIAAAFQVRFRATKSATWTLGGVVATASAADVSAPAVAN